MKVSFGIGPLTLSELAKRCQATLTTPEKANFRVSALCTDSREADGQTAFLTLPGEKDDGEAHIAEAAARGCPCIICTNVPETTGCFIQTPDRIQALLRLAETIRQEVAPHCVAVTGSAGKTTAKEFISSVLSQKGSTFKTLGNHNSLVGLPLSLLELKPGTEWAVLEMGMNHKGEIGALSKIVSPDLAAITNIGNAHVGMLGSQYDILQAKLEILSGLQQNGVFLLNVDDEFLRRSVGKNFRTISLSANGRKADFSAKNIRVELHKTIFDLNWRGGVETDLCLPVMGKQFVTAALFAYAAGIYAGVSPEAIRRGLAVANPGKLRQQISVCGGVTLIEDCYNASPESMAAALDSLDLLCQTQESRGIAILGDMLELGSESERLHYQVGKRFACGNAELLFTIGKQSERIALGARQNGVFSDQIYQNPDPNDLSGLLNELKTVVRPGDVILIKASRRIAAERVGSALKDFLEKGGQGPCVK